MTKKLKVIHENWEEIDKCLELIRENTEDPEANFIRNNVFLLNGLERNIILTAYYRSKIRGRFTKSVKEYHVHIKFCPFTGKPLYKEVE